MNTERETPAVVRDWLQARARQRPDSRHIVEAALLEIATIPQGRRRWAHASAGLDALRLRGGSVSRGLVWLAVVAMVVGALAIGYVVSVASRPVPLDLTVVPPAVDNGPTGLLAYTKGDEIHTLEAATGQDRLILQRPGVTGNLVGWSRDGRRILSADGTSSISVEPDGSDLRTVPLVDPSAWSPDASRFAHVVGGHVEVTDIDDTIIGRFPLPPTKGLDFLGPWSPDGSGILTVGCDIAQCGTSYSESLWRLDLASRTWHLVAPDGPGAITSVAWSPDGTRITFSTWNHEPGFRSAIRIVAPDGSGLTDLTPDATFSIGASWSPDGRTLAFASDRESISHAYTMRVDGTGVHGVTSGGPLSDFEPVWSPDGRWLAVVRQGSPNLTPDLAAAIWIVGADGSSARQMVAGTGLGGLAWQPPAEASLAPASPAPSATAPDASGWTSFTSSRLGYTARLPSNFEATPATAPWTTDSPPGPTDPAVDQFWTPGPYRTEFRVASRPLAAGETASMWIAGIRSGDLSLSCPPGAHWVDLDVVAQVQAIEGDPTIATSLEGCGYGEAVIVARGRIYEVWGGGQSKFELTPTTTRTIFGSFVSSIRFEPWLADDRPAPSASR